MESALCLRRAAVGGLDPASVADHILLLGPQPGWQSSGPSPGVAKLRSWGAEDLQAARRKEGPPHPTTEMRGPGPRQTGSRGIPGSLEAKPPALVPSDGQCSLVPPNPPALGPEPTVHGEAAIVSATRPSHRTLPAQGFISQE